MRMEWKLLATLGLGLVMAGCGDVGDAPEETENGPPTVVPPPHDHERDPGIDPETDAIQPGLSPREP